MTGTVTIDIKDPDVHYKLTLKRNITIIAGDGASGKTTLFNLVWDSVRRAKQLRISMTVNPSDVSVFSLDVYRWQKTLKDATGTKTVFVVDEDFEPLTSTEFASLVKSSGCYFILMTRRKLSGIPHSITERYRFLSSGVNGSELCLVPEYQV